MIKKAIPGDFNRKNQFVPATLQVPFLGRDEHQGFHGARAAGSRFQQLSLGPSIPSARTINHEVLDSITLGITCLLRVKDDGGLSNNPSAPSRRQALGRLLRHAMQGTDQAARKGCLRVKTCRVATVLKRPRTLVFLRHGVSQRQTYQEEVVGTNSRGSQATIDSELPA